jgi:HD-like signal output (HDOD) protein
MDTQAVLKTESAVPKLLALMDKDPGFAGVGASIQVVSELADDDGDSRALVNAILRDVALTSKLLRLSNASSRGTRSVSTIDQAISVLGLNTVRNVAISLSLLNGMGNKPQWRQLHAEVVAAYFCGTFAALITRFNGARFKPQETQVCALMQNLGRVMSTYYLFDELEASRYRQAEKNLSEEEAIFQSLGCSFAELSAAIAQAWNLPDGLQKGLAATKGKTQPKPSPTPADWQMTCSLFARHITDILFRMPDDREKMEITAETNFFRQALLLKNDELDEWIHSSLADTDALLEQLAFPLNVAQSRVLLRKASERVHDVISPQDSLAKSVGGNRSPIDQINQAMRMLHAQFEFDLTMVLLPEGTASVLAITGIGRHAHQTVPKFRCHGAKPDLFRLLMAKGADIYVPDTTSPAFVKLLPEWYPGQVGARSFQLIALSQNGKLRGMLYGDYTDGRAVTEREASPEAAQQWLGVIVNALAP